MATRKKPARSMSAWRAKNPVAKVLTRRLLAAERQIDQDDRRIAALVSVANDLIDRVKSAEQNLRDHEQTIGALAVVALSVLGRKPLDVSRRQLDEALNLLASYGGKSRSVTGSSETSRSLNNDSKSGS